MIDFLGIRGSSGGLPLFRQHSLPWRFTPWPKNRGQKQSLTHTWTRTTILSAAKSPHILPLDHLGVPGLRVLRLLSFITIILSFWRVRAGKSKKSNYSGTDSNHDLEDEIWHSYTTRRLARRMSLECTPSQCDHLTFYLWTIRAALDRGAEAISLFTVHSSSRWSEEPKIRLLRHGLEPRFWRRKMTLKNNTSFDA